MNLMKLQVTLETVTPLFLSGANQNKAELRPASVRGALRYWLRALLGSQFGDELTGLLDQESGVFGQIEQGSPVVVRLTGNLLPNSSFDLDKGELGKLPNGHNYLYYSTRLGGNQRVPFTPQLPDAISPLTLTLQTRLGVAEPQRILKLAGAAVWLLTNLGGLGMRSRRCGGSIQISQVLTTDESEEITHALPSFTVTAQTPDELRKNLYQGLRQICQLVPRIPNPSKEFDILHPDTCRVWVIPNETPWQTWKEAVEAIGSAMQTFRSGQGTDRNTKNSIFGIPIRDGPSYGLERRSSPLWLRITKLASGQYVGVATLFKSKFKSDKYEVGGGYRHIEDFVKSVLNGQEAC